MVTTKKIDHETNLALAAGLAAGAIGVVFGTPREAAAVAAISSLAGATISSQIPRNWAKSENRRLGSTVIATCLLFLAARGVGQKMPVEMAAAGLAGACGAVTFYKPTASTEFESLPFLVAMGYSVLSAHLFPTHRPTFANALLVVSATHLCAQEFTEFVEDDKAKNMIWCGKIAALLALHDLGRPIGFPVRWRQLWYAGIAMEAIPPLIAKLLENNDVHT